MFPSSARWALPLAAALLFSAPASAGGPRRTVIDRVVAVVDTECITKRQLERFAAPFVEAATRDLAPDAAQRVATVARVHAEALERLVDRALVRREAMLRELSVAPGDVDRALENVAASQGITSAQLLAEAKRQGMEEARYRTELHVQILEGKLVLAEMDVRAPGWRDLEPAARAERMERVRAAILADVRARVFVEIRL